MHTYTYSTHMYENKSIFLEIHAWMPIKLNYIMGLCIFIYANVNLKTNTFACTLISFHDDSVTQEHTG